MLSVDETPKIEAMDVSSTEQSKKVMDKTGLSPLLLIEVTSEGNEIMSGNIKEVAGLE